ncbi:hypothetical protein X740_27970 [Mesorhizobium sp. LNHC221B00]|nr:hypothetical protein X740_27970 [Mesorhizobium sp. LNHC221B00]
MDTAMLPLPSRTRTAQPFRAAAMPNSALDHHLPSDQRGFSERQLPVGQVRGGGDLLAAFAEKLDHEILRPAMYGCIEHLHLRLIVCV